MGYVKDKVAHEVADRMTERYGVKHHAVHNDRTNMTVVMKESDIKRLRPGGGGSIGSVNVVYP